MNIQIAYNRPMQDITVRLLSRDSEHFIAVAAVFSTQIQVYRPRHISMLTSVGLYYV